MSAVETAVARLVASFAEDLVVQWLDLPRPEDLFRPLAQEASSVGRLDLDLPGTVALWLPDSGERATEPPSARLPRRLRSYVDAMMAAHSGRGPHVHLQFVGVTPDHRGRGLGGRLLTRGLARARASGTPVRLEASTPRSALLYARHGFVRTGADIRLPEGPTLIPMWWHPAP